MAPKITTKKDYILVESIEPEFWEIWESLAKLLNMPEYPDKNVIWLFNEGPLKITYDDLYKIKDLLNENFPENSRPDKKLALVVTGGLHQAMATEYSKMLADFPVASKVFSDFDAAEEWIVK